MKKIIWTAFGAGLALALGLFAQTETSLRNFSQPGGVSGGGTGITSYTQGDMLYASAANTLSKLAKNTSATRYLSNTGSSNNPAWAQVNLANGVTGTLPVGNGGSGAATLTGLLKGNGTSAFTAGLSSDVIALWTGTCNSGTFLRADGSCQAAGGVAQTTGSFTVTWASGCTTQPTQNWVYTKTGNVVTVRMTAQVSCTSDTIGFSAAAGAFPAAIRPANTVILYGIKTVDNGTTKLNPGCIVLASDGALTTRLSTTTYCGELWTASGTKSILAASVEGQNNWTYTLD